MRIRGTLCYIKEVNANSHFHKIKRSGPKMKIMSCVTSFDHMIGSNTGQNIYPLDSGLSNGTLIYILYLAFLVLYPKWMYENSQLDLKNGCYIHFKSVNLDMIG